jgi:hypothetical protein
MKLFIFCTVLLSCSWIFVNSFLFFIDYKPLLPSPLIHFCESVTDASVFYFVVMIRHGFHIIFTQMVSTHDAMVRGSLDFPNLINLNNISRDFVVDVEIYGMVR